MSKFANLPSSLQAPSPTDAALASALDRLGHHQTEVARISGLRCGRDQELALDAAVSSESIAAESLIRLVAIAAGVDLAVELDRRESPHEAAHEPVAVHLAGGRMFLLVLGDDQDHHGVEVMSASGREVSVRVVVVDLRPGATGPATERRARRSVTGV